jgi:hypothetical protein
MGSAYTNCRTVTTLEGLQRMRLHIRRCRNPGCPRYHRPYRPEEEGRIARPQHEFGRDVIALLGVLRYQQQRSVPEIHPALVQRGVSICQRSVTHLLDRYDERVSLRLSDSRRLGRLRTKQGRGILALDGLQPEVGHEVLWVLRDCLSGEVLLARSLLSSTESDLAGLIREVQQGLCVPIVGVVSDGQHSIRNAVATALPKVAHQWGHFHYLREAARPLDEADRHAKKELKKRVRGIRPLERCVEARPDPAADAIRGYCSAVRSAFGLVQRAAAILDNPRQPSGAQVRRRYRTLLRHLRRPLPRAGKLPGAMRHFLKVTRSSWPGLFHGYAVPDLPRTNNGLEQLFGSTRHHERRCTGRKAASPSLVLRGSVRIVAGRGTRTRRWAGHEWAPINVSTWRTLRAGLEQRRSARSLRYRFRRDPAAYFAQLEALLLKHALPP